jgi:hypothetical protein
MASFQLTPVEKGILRCKHAGTFAPEDIQALAGFFHDYHGKLLVDLTETSAEECIRHIQQLRPMMPTAAIFGADIDPEILKVPKSYYEHEVHWFKTEKEALAWLREQ